MRAILFRLAAITLLIASVAAVQQTGAQETGADGKMPPMPKPAAELEKLAPLLGHWTGEGTVRMGPDAEEMPWSGTSSAKKILDGHFIESTTKLDVGAPAQMLYRSVHGWDPTRECYVAFEIGNSQGGAKSDIYWTPDGKLIGTSTTMENGHVMNDRWVTEFMKDTQKFVGYRSIDGGPAFAYVTGTMKRHDQPCTIPADSAEIALGPPNEHMSKLDFTVGSWRYKGWVAPMPGMGNLDIEGSQHFEKMLGGHAVLGKTVDEKTPYKSHNYFYWDAKSRSLHSFYINNMGEIGATGAYLEDGHLVMGHAGMMRGRFMALETRMTTGPDKMTAVGHALMNGKAIKTMEMTTTRVKP